MEKVDVAVNIFGKPWTAALTLLSLIDNSGERIAKLWTQFEPVGMKYDRLNPYLIIDYLREKGRDVVVSQPAKWVAREAVDEDFLKSAENRLALRYGAAFENSDAKYLLLIHNDILVFKDLIGAMLANIGDSFAIGQLGQCWNCPAAKASITEKIMKCPPCDPDNYDKFRPDLEELRGLYREGKEQGIFARPYDGDNFKGEFEERPWPLPECRINEWACLIDMEMVRPYCAPNGDAWPPGAYRLCAGHNLDIAAPFFRDLHAKGLRAKNMDLKPYMKHWVGTGKNTPMRYAKLEDNSKKLIQKHYPEFAEHAAARGD